MKPKVYLETSIISYLTARPSNNVIVAGHQLTTLDWWNRERENFDLVVSDLVLVEAGKGDAEMVEARLRLAQPLKSLTVTDEAIELVGENNAARSFAVESGGGRIAHSDCDRSRN